ncbi:hypothetical protein [Elioraea sp.]|uniref:hypothetical protein n=1 Tax=Elioraea sp. TaxID=2185103 RepID=UPI0025BB26D9|nr:hypothetical protein [Elioraea sp.]
MSDLARARLAARKQVDDLAETACQQWASPGPCRNAIYGLVREQALACLADPAPTAEAYELLAAQIPYSGATVAEVASVVAATASAWISIERSALIFVQQL